MKFIYYLIINKFVLSSKKIYFVCIVKIKDDGPSIRIELRRRIKVVVSNHAFVLLLINNTACKT